MNIADKPRFCREAIRVLRPGGVLALANVCAGPAARLITRKCGPRPPQRAFWRHPTIQGATWRRPGLRLSPSATLRPISRRSARSVQPPERGAGPPLGIHVLMGEETVREAQRNSARNIAERRLVTIEALLRKPG